MTSSPIKIFQKWYAQELKLTSDRIPSACCLSTLGIDGFPNARFISLKDIVDNNFIVTGNIMSRKGLEINNSDKVALTFWWSNTEKQVRVQGHAYKISEQLADKYFSERTRDSQIVSLVSAQGEELLDMENLIKSFDEVEAILMDKEISRPENWGGFSVEPKRIEFLEFVSSRFHYRNLFELINGNWELKKLQP